jgi:hypothetical protein
MPKRTFGRRAITAVVGAATLALVAAGCSTINTAPDQAGLHYKAGAVSSTKFADCVTSSNRNWYGPGDKTYTYPAGQRTFDFTGSPGSESGPLTVVSQDNQELQVQGGLTFQLDTSCDKITINGKDYPGGILQAFHENIGIKYAAYMDDNDKTSDGWDEMLRFYIGQPLKKAMNQAAQKYGWLAIYNDPATRVKWETEVKTLLPAAVKATTGGADYFKNFSLTLQKPEPDPKLVSALAAAQVAITNKQAVIDQNATVDEELKQIKKLTAVLGPEGYILYKALQLCATSKDNAGCPAFIPVPQGSSLNITPPTKASSAPTKP